MNSPAVVSRDRLAAMMDFTLDSPRANAADVRALVSQAIVLGVGQICVPPSLLHATSKAQSHGIRVVAECGFPSGKHHELIKASEARLAVEFGAAEVDMVVDLAAVKDCDTNRMISEIVAVREAVPHPVTLKVIIETAGMTGKQVITAARACRTAGADYIRTSTGYHPDGGATVTAVEVLHREVGGQLGIEAAGGIDTLDQALIFIRAGATRISVTDAEKILTDY